MTKKTEQIGKGLTKTTSDKSKMLRQVSTGILYAEAVDPIGSAKAYVETEIDIPATTDEAPADCLRDPCPLVIAEAVKIKAK